MEKNVAVNKTLQRIQIAERMAKQYFQNSELDFSSNLECLRVCLMKDREFRRLVAKECGVSPATILHFCQTNYLTSIYSVSDSTIGYIDKRKEQFMGLNPDAQLTFLAGVLEKYEMALFPFDFVKMLEKMLIKRYKRSVATLAEACNSKVGEEQASEKSTYELFSDIRIQPLSESSSSIRNFVKQMEHSQAEFYNDV